MLAPMTLLHLARATGLVLGAGLVASACSSAPAPPQAFVFLQMSADSPAAEGMCVGYPSDTTLMQIGMPGDPNASPMPTPPTRITTGAQHIQIACTVHQEGDSFAVNLQIAQGDVSSAGATTLTVTGMVSASTGGMNLTSDVSNTSAGDYHSTACVITFDTSTMNGAGAAPSGTPIAPGRIWAHLSCPADQNSNITTGSGAPSTCDAEADFIFENCNM
jgi:hypothetical protein